MAPKKPSGNTGVNTVTFNDALPVKRWVRMELPTDKAAIEREIVRLFGWEFSKKGALVIWRQNLENDFDFDLQLAGGKVHLDLVEIIYWSGQKRPFDSAQEEVQIGVYVEQIVAQIMKKSAHYSSNIKHPIHLLCYITHWAFRVSEPVVLLVRQALRKTPPIFENVFLLTTRTRDAADLRVLVPSNPSEISGREAELHQYSERVYYNGNPDKITLEHSPDGTSLSWKVDVDWSKFGR